MDHKLVLENSSLCHSLYTHKKDHSCLGLLSNLPLELSWISVDFQHTFCLFFKLGFTPCEAEQPLRGMELQEKEAQKDQSVQEICLEIYS